MTRPVEGFPYRLASVLGNQSQRAFARKIGISATALGQYISGQSEPTRPVLIAIADALDVSIEWLVTGEGWIRPEAIPKGLEAPIAMAAAGYAMLPRFDVSASAGPGLLTDQENIVDYMAFRTEWIRRAVGARPEDLCLITALGDSMEPTIRSGDLLLIDRSIDRILDDAIYVIVRSEVLVVKRIQRFFKGAVVIKSDNPNYIDETIGAGDLDDLRVAGRVRWIARMI